MIRYESPKTRLHTYVAFSSAWLVDHNKRKLILLAPFEPWMEQYERRERSIRVTSAISIIDTYMLWNINKTLQFQYHHQLQQ